MHSKSGQIAIALAMAIFLGCGGPAPESGSAEQKASIEPEGKAEKPTFAFVTNNASNFWAIAKKGLEKAESELRKAKQKPEPPAVIAAAEKRVEAAKANLPALEARIAADLAAMSTPVPANAEELAVTARKK